jgi:poly(A) polymerase
MPLAIMEDVKSVIGPDASRLLAEIRKTLSKDGIKAYIVGGFVRDVLLGRRTADIDVAVAGDALAIAPAAAAALGGKCVPLDPENGVARVVLPGGKWEVDFTTLGGDIGNDLARRDFTINAIALALEEAKGAVDKGSLIDPFHGLDDLGRRLVKAVSDGVFRSDPARLVRALRLSAELV